MSQKQQDSSFSFQEEQQQMQLMRKMEDMQREYEKMRLRCEQLRNKRQVNVSTNNNKLTNKPPCTQPLISNKPHLNLAQTQILQSTNAITNYEHRPLQSQQQSFSFQNSSLSVPNNLSTVKDTDPQSLSTDTFAYNESKLQSFQYEKSYINADSHYAVSSNKQLPARQSVLSDSQQESFQFKEYDSIPTANYKGAESIRRQYNKQTQQSFTYKSSTGEESFSYQASDGSLTSALTKQTPPLTEQMTTRRKSSRIGISLDESQIPVSQSQHVEESFVFNIKEQPIAKDGKVQKENKDGQLGQDGSFEASRSSNGGNYSYNIREFSFRLPDSIHDPFQIKTKIQPISEEKHQVHSGNANINRVTTNKPVDNPLKIATNNRNSLQEISCVFDHQYESEQEEFIFLKKLVNKLSMRKKMSMKQIKRLSIQMKQIAQKNMELVEIFETGTYELDYNNKGVHIDWTQKYIEKLNSWNTKMFITQLSFNNMQSPQAQQSFFKNVDFPSLQQLTFYFQNLTFLNDDGSINKRPDQKVSITFLRYHGLSKRLKVLSLRGETMVLQIAKDLVDLDFSNLKSLYIGFETHLTHQIIQILTCAQFSNMPKCTIYIATWDGDINTRFRPFYDKVKFIPLQLGQQQLSNQQLKARAKQLKFKRSHKQAWKQGLCKDLGNYFQNQQDVSLS